MKHMKSTGESGSPCFTPVSVLKKFEKLLHSRLFAITHIHKIGYRQKCGNRLMTLQIKLPVNSCVEGQNDTLVDLVRLSDRKPFIQKTNTRVHTSCSNKYISSHLED